MSLPIILILNCTLSKGSVELESILNHWSYVWATLSPNLPDQVVWLEQALDMVSVLITVSVLVTDDRAVGEVHSSLTVSAPITLVIFNTWVLVTAQL